MSGSRQGPLATHGLQKGTRLMVSQTPPIITIIWQNSQNRAVKELWDCLHSGIQHSGFQSEVCDCWHGRVTVPDVI